jgi:hypothetical protein
LRWRRVPAADARRALDEYRHRHPLYTRVLLSVIARTNGLPATSSADLADALPVLAFRFEAGEEVTP